MIQRLSMATDRKPRGFVFFDSSYKNKKINLHNIVEHFKYSVVGCLQIQEVASEGRRCWNFGLLEREIARSVS